MNSLGYSKPLYILPFDHRGSFVEKMFGVKNREATPEEVEQVIEMKKLIYEAFKKSLEVIPREDGAVLADEQFAGEVLLNASQNGIATLLTTEKSGQKEFDFEYGDTFGDHIKKYNPTFAKALVRYNPEEDREMNQRQLERLKRLSDFCHENGIKVLVEPLIPATIDQLSTVENSEERYDDEIRPRLVVTMMKEFQDRGVEVDVWKIEGLNKKEDYEKAVIQAKSSEARRDVGIVILGRGAGPDQVKRWIQAGKDTEGVIGFAVGRTVFWEPLVDFRDKKITREEALNKISENFLMFYKTFTQ